MSQSDYYPFGMLLPGRNSSEDEYRYGFNGMEMDDEIHEVKGSSYDFGAWLYNSRVGRWLSRDPLESMYPSIAPYTFVANSTLIFVDPNGMDIIPSLSTPYSGGAPKRASDLGQTSMTEKFNYLYNSETGNVDIYIGIQIVYTRSWEMPGANGKTIEGENSGAFLAVSTHENVHVSQIMNVAKMTNINATVTIGGVDKYYNGLGDVVMTNVRHDYLEFRSAGKEILLNNEREKLESSITFDDVYNELRENSGIYGPISDGMVESERQARINSALAPIESEFDQQTEDGLAVVMNATFQDVAKQMYTANGPTVIANTAQNGGPENDAVKTTIVILNGSDSQKYQTGQSIKYQGKPLK